MKQIWHFSSAICSLVFTILRRACGEIAASGACLVLLAVFAFSQYVPIANYNYVTPYQHYQTHGIALSLTMIAAFGRALKQGGTLPPVLAGLCLGLVFLTKTELFVPALAAGLAGLAALLACEQRGHRVRVGAAFTAAMLAPPLVFFAFLAVQMPAQLALRGVLGNWA